MTIREIIEQCSHLEVDEKRASAPNYHECVIFAKDIVQWEEALIKSLGSPEKAPGEKTTQAHFSLTINYGGLRDNQTLFYRKSGNESFIAMFWPWKDKAHITLKIACFKE